MFMTAPNLVPDAILQIHILNENAMTNSAEGVVLIVNIGSLTILCRRKEWELA